MSFDEFEKLSLHEQERFLETTDNKTRCELLRGKINSLQKRIMHWSLFLDLTNNFKTEVKKLQYLDDDIPASLDQSIEMVELKIKSLSFILYSLTQVVKQMEKQNG